MASSSKVCVIGAGGMGIAVSVLLSGKNHTVGLWTPFKEEAVLINEHKENKEKLPGIKLPPNVYCTSNINDAMSEAFMVVLAVPSQAMSGAIADIASLVGEETIVACFSKGLEEKTGLRMSEVIKNMMPWVSPVVLSGPCHAEELARKIPSAYVAASEDMEKAMLVQDIFMTPYFRVYTNPDVIGVELGGALKNVIAICAGIAEGLGYGDNTKAALMTRGIVEIRRLGVAMGAEASTFGGLTGIGDLIVTCTSMHSRNRRAGILIGKGCALDQALNEIKMVVEGVWTAKAALNLANKYKVEMPIVYEANQVLFKGKSPRDAVTRLMTRSKKDEMEEVY